MTSTADRRLSAPQDRTSTTMATSSPTPVRWESRLNGPSADLTRLSKTLHGPDLLLTAHADEFYLGGSVFDELPDADAVRHKVGVIATSLTVSMGIIPPLGVGPIVRLDADGSRPMWIHAPCAVAAVVGVPPVVTVTHRDGVIKDIGAERAQQDALKSLHSEAVRKVQRLLLGGELSWTDLVRVFEVIESDGCVPRESENWRLGKRLTGTANSVTLTGDECRHGKESKDKAPPRNPMTISEARDFIDRLYREWIARK